MPGFQQFVAGQISAVFGPIEFDFTNGFDQQETRSRISRLFERTFPEYYEKCS